jgi:uncharacterized protein (TIGR03084 family)
MSGTDPALVRYSEGKQTPMGDRCMSASASADMAILFADLKAEYTALASLCDELSSEQWRLPSAFYGWTAWDEIAHLYYFDDAALLSATDPERFRSEAGALAARMARGDQISDFARELYSGMDGPELVQRWRERFGALIDTLGGMDPSRRLDWYGPPMSLRSFATARMMETWAHGQDIWDTLRRRRPATQRLRHIAHLGVSTLGWSFVNRKMEPPKVQAFVGLTAPDGALWTWGPEDAQDRVTGLAEDFCLVVTQRRHVNDTGLVATPGPMAQWLSLAQCFAGPALDNPAPGVRAVAYGV